MAILFEANEREETSIPITEVWKDGEIDIFPEVQNQKYFEVRFRGRRLIITAGKYVGFIPLNERVIIYVKPKTPVSNLIQLLAIAGGVVTIGKERQYRLAASTAPPLLEAMAGAFITYLEEIEVAGLFKTYLNMSEAQSVLKGQIKFQESMQQMWSQGKRHIAVSSYFELTGDVPENQLLYFACRSLILHFLALNQSPATLKVLGDFEELFSQAGVTLRLPGKHEIHEEGLSAGYIRALRLADALIARQGVELPLGGTDIFLPSFLVDMEALFEEYIIRVLSQHLPRYRVAGSAEGVRPLFDNAPAPAANPDVVIFSQNNPIALGDVKYKPRYSREDLNQVISYGLSYSVKIAVLFLPALSVEEAILTNIGEIKGIRVFQSRVWLGATDLALEARRMATDFNALLPPPAQAA